MTRARRQRTPQRNDDRGTGLRAPRAMPETTQLSLPLQRERRTRTSPPPFICEDPISGKRWYGIGREPQWVKAYKARHYMYPVKQAGPSATEFAALAARVSALEECAGIRRAA